MKKKTDIAFQLSLEEQALPFATPDGARIYCKSFELSWHNGQQNEEQTIAHGIEDLKAIVGHVAWSRRPSDNLQIPMPFAHTSDSSSHHDFRVEGDNIVLRTRSDQSTLTEIRMTIFYTKNESGEPCSFSW